MMTNPYGKMESEMIDADDRICRKHDRPLDLACTACVDEVRIERDEARKSLHECTAANNHKAGMLQERDARIAELVQEAQHEARVANRLRDRLNEANERLMADGIRLAEFRRLLNAALDQNRTWSSDEAFEAERLLRQLEGDDDTTASV